MNLMLATNTEKEQKRQMHTSWESGKEMGKAETQLRNIPLKTFPYTIVLIASN